MQTSETVIKGLEIPTPSQVWQMVKDWVETVLTSEQKAEVALTAGTVVLMGYVAFVLHQGLENYAIYGTPPF